MVKKIVEKLKMAEGGIVPTKETAKPKYVNPFSSPEGLVETAKDMGRDVGEILAYANKPKEMALDKAAELMDLQKQSGAGENKEFQARAKAALEYVTPSVTDVLPMGKAPKMGAFGKTTIKKTAQEVSEKMAESKAPIILETYAERQARAKAALEAANLEKVHEAIRQNPKLMELYDRDPVLIVDLMRKRMFGK